MTISMRFVGLLLISLAGFSSVASADGPICGADPSERRWMSSMLDMWTAVAASDLDATPAIPWIIFFDQRCVHHLNPDMASVYRLTGEGAVESTVPSRQGEFSLVSAEHSGEVVLPDGKRVPAQVISFASVREEDHRPYFVMAMPEVWRESPRHASHPRLDLLVAAVLAHEMTHTLQSAAFGERLDAFEREHAGIALDDDIVQNTFENDEQIASLASEIRNLLYSAAATADRTEAATTAGRAVALMHERRKLMDAKDSDVASLEDHFLLMEGIANWAGMRAIVRSGLEPDAAIEMMRGSGKWWSQDEGLAVMLVLDRFSDDWQHRVLTDPTLSLARFVEDALR